MITLDMPTDSKLMAAVGRVAIRHGQLGYVLQMTLKSIEGISVREALDATERLGSSELRRRVRKSAKQKFGDGPTLTRLDALLTRCRRATANRNEILHSLWAQDKEGNLVIRDDDGHNFRPPPTKLELKKMAGELAKVASDLNEARLSGFLRDALNDAQ